MKNELDKIERYLEHKDRVNGTVSEVNVAWHLDHSLKVVNEICDALQSSNPNDYKRKFNFLRTVVFAKGSIPKGKGRAPKSVLPPENIKTEDIVSQLAKAKEKIEGFDKLSAKSNFKHPIFGILNKKQSKRCAYCSKYFSNRLISRNTIFDKSCTIVNSFFQVSN